MMEYTDSSLESEKDSGEESTSGFRASTVLELLMESSCKPSRRETIRNDWSTSGNGVSEPQAMDIVSAVRKEL